MRLIIASNNAHKVTEIKQILGGFFPEIFSQSEAGVLLEVEEDGHTFAQNAIKKAEQTLCQTPGFGAALADDSGLMVDALHGAPGVYSARYAGDGHNDEDNNRKLLHEMRHVPEEQRACRFASAVALARRGRPTICVMGECEGLLLREARGQGGFGYDPLFYYPPAAQTFSEMTAGEKNSISHRRRALEALKVALEQE